MTGPGADTEDSRAFGRCPRCERERALVECYTTGSGWKGSFLCEECFDADRQSVLSAERDRKRIPVFPKESL